VNQGVGWNLPAIRRPASRQLRRSMQVRRPSLGSATPRRSAPRLRWLPRCPTVSRGKASVRRGSRLAGGRKDAARDRAVVDVDVRSCNWGGKGRISPASAPTAGGALRCPSASAISATSRLVPRRSKTGRCARNASRRAATGLAVDRFARNADRSRVANDGAATARPDQRADHPARLAGGRANGARPVPLIVASPAGATSMTTSPA
jgi:hypothetical protein